MWQKKWKVLKQKEPYRRYTIYIYDRDNMRTNLDIAGDYINEASGIIKELREGLQDG